MNRSDIKSESFKKLVILFRRLGVSDEKLIELLNTFNKRYRCPIDTFYKKSVDLVNFLLKLGINEEKVGSILCGFYPIFTYDLEFFDNNVKRLLTIGLSQEEIAKMVTLCPNVLAISSKVDESFEFLYSLGYTKEDVVSMIKKSPSFLNHSIRFIKDRVEFYKSTGMSEEDAIKVVKRAPSLINYSNEALENRIKDLMDIGFTRETIYSILRVNPTILAYTKEAIMDKLNTLIEFGFTKEEAISIYSRQKTLFTMNTENIRDKIRVIKECDYEDDNVRDILKRYPGVVSLSSDSIKDKITFYSSLGLHNILVREPKHLMQSLSLSKARSGFLEARGIKIDPSNYRRLFMGEKDFIKQFKKTNEEVLAEYGLRLKR